MAFEVFKIMQILVNINQNPCQISVSVVFKDDLSAKKTSFFAKKTNKIVNFVNLFCKFVNPFDEFVNPFDESNVH